MLTGKRKSFGILMLTYLALLKSHHLLGLGEALAGNAIVQRKVLVALMLACRAQQTLICDSSNAVALLSLAIQYLLIKFVFVEFVHLLNF